MAHHHDVPEGPFRLVHLVRVADRLANALGFPVIASMDQPSIEDALGELPEAMRSRFEYDPQQLKSEIGAKIAAWH